jgi:hypothetical protein
MNKVRARREAIRMSAMKPSQIDNLIREGKIVL